MASCDLGGPDLWLKTEKADQPNTYRLAPEGAFLKRHLPAVSTRETFTFRPGVHIAWSHYYPPAKPAEHVTSMLMTRDPRDALFSQYRRIGCRLPFASFLQLPSSDTLLPMATDWRLYHEAWLACANRTGLVLFEDYRRDAIQTLTRALKDMNIAADAPSIQRAAEASDFKRAQSAETKHKKESGDTAPTMNRAGIAQEWQTRANLAEAFQTITDATAPVLKTLGYLHPEPSHPATNTTAPDTANARAYIQLLPSLDQQTDQRVWPSINGNPNTPPEEDALVQAALRSVRSLDWNTLKDAGYQPYQINRLFRRYGELIANLVKPNY